MNNLIADKLKQLINNYGISILENHQQFHDLLLEYCPQNSREVFLLSSALKTKGFVSKLLNITPNMPKDISLGQIYFQLQENLYITPQSAKWVVETLAIALNLISPQEWNPSASNFVPQFSKQTPKILNNIIIDHGSLICEDWQKLMAYLNDYSQNINENQLLAKAAKIGIIKSLISSKKNNLSLSQVTIDELIQELENEFFLLPEAGKWVIKTWLEVLNINYIKEPKIEPIIVEEIEEREIEEVNNSLIPEVINRENKTDYIEPKPDLPKTKKQNNQNILAWISIVFGLLTFLLVGNLLINSLRDSTTTTVIKPTPVNPTNPVNPINPTNPTNPTESPEEFLKKYFALISEGDYETSWQYLTPEFIKAKGNYRQYTDWWQQVNRIDVGKVEILSPNKQEIAQEVRVQLTYYKKNGKVSTESRIWILIWDSNKNSWLFYD